MNPSPLQRKFGNATKFTTRAPRRYNGNTIPSNTAVTLERDDKTVAPLFSVDKTKETYWLDIFNLIPYVEPEQPMKPGDEVMVSALPITETNPGIKRTLVTLTKDNPKYTAICKAINPGNRDSMIGWEYVVPIPSTFNVEVKAFQKVEHSTCVSVPQEIYEKFLTSSPEDQSKIASKYLFLNNDIPSQNLIDAEMNIVNPETI